MVVTNDPASVLPHSNTSTLLSADATAAFLGVQVRTLANWRVQGRGPKYVRIGRRPFYRNSDIEGWLEERVFSHTGAELATRTSR